MWSSKKVFVIVENRLTTLRGGVHLSRKVKKEKKHEKEI